MIRLENVTKQFGVVKAVDQVNLHITPGEFLVLIGPSGCGKTTTMKMINRLIDPSAGRILIKGKDISAEDPIQLRRQIGYAIQEIGLLPHMTIADNIALVPRLLKWPKKKQRQRVEELLEMVGLDAATFMHKYPRQLSGGQRQRVGVARALAVDPPIMLMDEPFGALDPITREQMQDEFIKLQEQVKKTIVFVTHDMDEALKFADRVAIMNHGKIIQCDSPEMILRRPANKFVRDFVGSDHTLKQLSLIKVKEAMITDIDTLHPDNTIAQAKELFNRGSSNIVVVAKTGEAIGYINREDLNKTPEDRFVSEITVNSISTVASDKTLKDALTIMLKNDAGYIAVSDENRKPVGLITSSRLRQIVSEPRLNSREEQ
ncbi:MAG: betaine/proline/choline family ABC transporter ATP-binding protein [Dethiobacteria bacterium]